jgi:predicted DNA-binding protein YlxM (UPF0122 family)
VAVDAAEALCVTLWYIGNQVSMRDVGDRFNVSKSTLHKLLYKVCHAIVSSRDKFIVWPTADAADIKLMPICSTNIQNCLHSRD